MFFFFFKQKTAYELRISYWSSDVCSSDLIGRESAITLARQDHAVVINYAGSAEDADNTVREIESFGGKAISVRADVASSEQVQNQIGRATCRERGCQNV